MEIPESLNWISEVEDIDPSEGLKNCGRPEQYAKFVRTFFDTIDSRIQDIETAYDSKDLYTYTIKVHSLKSTARILGAKELSKLAEKLEYAGEKPDMAVIDEKTRPLLDMLASFKEKLAPIETMGEASGNSADKPEISPDEMENAYSAMREFVPEMDYDAVERVLSELNEYTLPLKDRQKVKELEKLLRCFDWDAMESMLSAQSNR